MPVTDTNLRSLLDAVLVQVPTLTYFGVGLYRNGGYPRPTAQAMRARIAEGQATLYDHIEEFAAVYAWLPCIRKIRTFSSMTSYGWKHVAEHYLGRYISNGTAIAAAVALGYGYRLCRPNSPNMCFTMSQRDCSTLLWGMNVIVGGGGTSGMRQRLMAIHPYAYHPDKAEWTERMIQMCAPRLTSRQVLAQLIAEDRQAVKTEDYT